MDNPILTMMILKKMGLLNPKSKEPNIFYRSCKRCDAPVASSRQSMQHPLGGICPKCITPAKQEIILRDTASNSLSKARKKYNTVDINKLIPQDLYYAFHGNNPKGSQLYLWKEKPGKYPYFISRGIIG